MVTLVPSMASTLPCRLASSPSTTSTMSPAVKAVAASCWPAGSSSSSPSVHPPSNFSSSPRLGRTPSTSTAEFAKNLQRKPALVYLFDSNIMKSPSLLMSPPMARTLSLSKSRGLGRCWVFFLLAASGPPAGLRAPRARV